MKQEYNNLKLRGYHKSNVDMIAKKNDGSALVVSDADKLQ